MASGTDAVVAVARRNSLVDRMGPVDWADDTESDEYRHLAGCAADTELVDHTGLADRANRMPVAALVNDVRMVVVAHSRPLLRILVTSSALVCLFGIRIAEHTVYRMGLDGS